MLEASRLIAGLAVAAAGLLPASWAGAAAMGPEEAYHLLNRAGFGATPQEVAQYARLPRAQAVDKLFRESVAAATTPPPESALEYLPPGRLRGMSEEERKALFREQRETAIDLRGWWVREMLATPSPLSERMTLFWHNHFVSSLQKVKSAKLMYRQNELLRRHALGNFRTLLHAVAKDPAMLIYLDSATNRKEQPNENFAREVMELFTLGEGRYTERDIKEAARAFTGWSLDPRSGEFLWRMGIHDHGVKTVLGRTGDFDGDAVLDILLAQSHTAEFIVEKLWREFVSPAPDPAEVRRVAWGFRNSGYEIKTALRELLLSWAFWAQENRGALVKSPVDWVVGSLRQFGFQVADPLPFVFALRQLGQDLFAPPNVKGWPGGEAWINSATLLARKQFAERLFRADASMTAGMPPAPGERSGTAGKPADAGRERLLRAVRELRFDSRLWLAETERAGLTPEAVMLATAPERESVPQAQGVQRIRLLALDPAYQVK